MGNRDDGGKKAQCKGMHEVCMSRCFRGVINFGKILRILLEPGTTTVHNENLCICGQRLTTDHRAHGVSRHPISRRSKLKKLQQGLL